MSEAPAHQTSVPMSPCVQVCRIDSLLQLCLGCGRTLDEIGSWGKLTETQRLQVMGQLGDRMARLEPQRRAAGLEPSGTAHGADQ
ncbi:MAG: DUF1289 domain-containing protein [Pseudomonadota bacterium]